MRYFGGWIRSYRKIFLTELPSDPQLFVIFSYILHTANFSETTITWEGKARKLLPGQNLISTREIGSELKIDQNKVQRAIKHLEKREFLIREVTHRGQILTICNYEKYQGSEKEDDSQSDSLVIHRRFTGDSQVIQQEELKKGRIEETRILNPPLNPPAGGEEPLAAKKPRVKKPKVLTRTQATEIATRIVNVVSRWGPAAGRDASAMANAEEHLGELGWMLINRFGGWEDVCKLLGKTEKTAYGPGRWEFDASRLPFVVPQMRDALIGISGVTTKVEKKTENREASGRILQVVGGGIAEK